MCLAVFCCVCLQAVFGQTFSEPMPILFLIERDGAIMPRLHEVCVSLSACTALHSQTMRDLKHAWQGTGLNHSRSETLTEGWTRFHAERHGSHAHGSLAPAPALVHTENAMPCWGLAVTIAWPELLAQAEIVGSSPCGHGYLRSLHPLSKVCCRITERKKERKRREGKGREGKRREMTSHVRHD